MTNKAGFDRNLKSKTGALKEDMGRIRQLLEDGDEDSAILKFQRASLRAVLDLIPVAEREYRAKPTMSNAYAFNALLSQSRELITDIEAAKESSQLVDTILDTYVRPMFLTLASHLLNSSTILRSELQPLYKGKVEARAAKASIDSFIRETARYLEDSHNKLREDISNGLE